MIRSTCVVTHWFAKVLSVVLLSALILFVGCSSSPKPSPTIDRTRPAAAEPVAITWSFWGDSWELQTNQRMLRAFEREHPEIAVRIEHRPWSEYFTWLRGEWARGASPDLMFLNSIPSYAAQGELASIEPWVQRDQVNTGDFYPALLEGFRLGGRLYGLPRDNDTKVVFYNRAHLAEAGLQPPLDTWTWEDLRTMALRLTRRDDGLGRAGFGFEPDWWLPWVWQHGGDAVDHPFRPSQVKLTDEQAIAALQFMQDLIYKDGVTPPVKQLNSEEMSRLFREGNLSMLMGNHTLVPWLSNTPGLSWDVAPLPRDARAANVAGGAGFAISRRSDARQQEAAWQLLHFLTSPKGQSMLAESGVITPARRSVREDNIFLRQRPYRAQVFVAESENGRSYPDFSGAAEFYRVVGAALAPVWAGERTPAEALSVVAPELRRIVEAPRDEPLPRRRGPNSDEEDGSIQLPALAPSGLVQAVGLPDALRTVQARGEA